MSVCVCVTSTFLFFRSRSLDSDYQHVQLKLTIPHCHPLVTEGTAPTGNQTPALCSRDWYPPVGVADLQAEMMHDGGGGEINM